jgi:transposase InsO family protein
VKYGFIKAHWPLFSIRAMRRVLKVHPSGFYAWPKSGLSHMAKRHRRLTGLIKQFWLESDGVYGYRNIHHDLLGLVERCAANTVAKLMKKAGFQRIRWKIYKTLEKARQDIFDYIELFYSPKRKHGNNLMLSPITFERQHKMKQQGI